MKTKFNLLDSLALAKDLLSTPPYFNQEEYRLDVDSNMILLLGQNKTGIFHGIQTLIQLIKLSSTGNP